MTSDAALARRSRINDSVRERTVLQNQVLLGSIVLLGSLVIQTLGHAGTRLKVFNDPWAYRLPEAYDDFRWVRYYNDALLVDVYTGEVVDVIQNIFW